MLRVEAAIESDRARLSELRADLESRGASFESLTAELTEAADALEKARSQLEEAGDAERPDLQAEADRLAEIHAQIQKRSDLAFRARKTGARQVVALEEKLAADEAGLAALRGVAPNAAPEEAGPLAAPPSHPQARPDSGLLLPGIPAAAQPATPRKKTAERSETVEQIEARLDAVAKEEDAREAVRAVEDFISRKAALEEQIALERKLLRNAEETQQSLIGAIEATQVRLETEITRGASRDELRRAQRKVREVESELEKTRAEIDKRNAALGGLHERLESAQQDQLHFTRAAEKKSEDAAAARQKAVWLESPLHPRNLRAWAVERLPRIAAVLAAIAAALLVVRVLARQVARAVSRSGVAKRVGRINRADTLAAAFRSAASVLIVTGGSLLALEEAGVDITTLLGGAAILGVALAFGAQNLMRDYLNGFMIMVEDQYELEDLLTIGAITGRVERVNMRTTVLRDIEGRLHFIPNGEIKTVTNRTYEWAQPVFDIRVSYKENVDRVMAVLLEVAEELRVDPEWGSSIVGEPMMLGVDRLEESGVIIKFMLKTQPDKLFPVRRETLRRIKNRFDELGIEIPVPHRVVIHRHEGETIEREPEAELPGPKAVPTEGR